MFSDFLCTFLTLRFNPISVKPISFRLRKFQARQGIEHLSESTSFSSYTTDIVWYREDGKLQSSIIIRLLASPSLCSDFRGFAMEALQRLGDPRLVLIPNSGRNRTYSLALVHSPWWRLAVPHHQRTVNPPFFLPEKTYIQAEIHDKSTLNKILFNYCKLT